MCVLVADKNTVNVNLLKANVNVNFVGTISVVIPKFVEIVPYFLLSMHNVHHND